MMSTYEKRIRVYKGQEQFERVLSYQIPSVGDRIRHLNGNLAEVKEVCYSADGEPFVIADFAGHFGVTVAIDQFKVVRTIN